MANNYTFPGGVNTYVPTLHSDLIVEFSRNPNKFALNRYTDIRKVDKQKGYFVQMKNDGQARVVSDTDNIWPEGTDSPKVIEGTDQHEFGQYNCVRRRLPKMLGYLSVEQAGWDILDQEARFLAMQMMTARVKRVHKTLTTAANWGSNAGNASVIGGGVWSAASATNPYIRTSLAAAQITVTQQTLGVVQATDLYGICNPNTAKQIATSGEFLDFVKQQPGAIAIWENQPQYRLYGLPENVMGLNMVVDDTVYNSALPGQTASLSFTFPDNVFVIMTKQKAIQPAAGSGFSTFQLFAYEEFVTEVFNDVENRRYKLFVTENVDDSFLFAPQSGYMITTNA